MPRLAQPWRSKGNNSEDFHSDHKNAGVFLFLGYVFDKRRLLLPHRRSTVLVKKLSDVGRTLEISRHAIKTGAARVIQPKDHIPGVDLVRVDMGAGVGISRVTSWKILLLKL